MAKQMDLSQIGKRRSSGANAQLPGFEKQRIESPVPARDNLHPFLTRGDPFRRLSLSPQRRRLSPVASGGAHARSTPHVPLAHGGDDGLGLEDLRGVSAKEGASSGKGKGRERTQVEQVAGLMKEQTIVNDHPYSTAVRTPSLY